MSAENGIGTAGRISPVDDESQPVESDRRVEWPKGLLVPFPSIKRDSKSAGAGRNWAGFVSTLGEIAGISAFSVGCGWFSPGLGLMSAGIGIFAVSFVAGIPKVGSDKR